MDTVVKYLKKFLDIMERIIIFSKRVVDNMTHQYSRMDIVAKYLKNSLTSWKGLYHFHK